MAKIVKDIQITRLLTPEGTETCQLNWNYIVPEVTDITLYSIWRCDSQEGTYEKIDTTVLNNYQDQSADQIPGLMFWYKVTYTSTTLGESSISEATPCSLVTYQDTGLNTGLYYIMGEQIRRMNFATLNVGEPCNIYLRKRVGLRCPECWNERTKQADDPKCTICFGTGFVGGYTKVSAARVIIEQAEEKIMDSPTGFDVKQSVRARIANTPILSEQDMLCRQNNVHYLITAVDPRMVQNYLVEQIFSMEQLDPSFPAYLLE
jgi:hypothetical protein